MRTPCQIFSLLTLTTLTLALPPLDSFAQDNAAPAATPAADQLVRVQAADIGPKNGDGELKSDQPRKADAATTDGSGTKGDSKPTNDEGWEAPTEKDSADLFEAPLNAPFYGHLGTEDQFDLYGVDLKAAGNPAKLNLSLAFSDVDMPCKFLVEAFDATGKKRLARFTKLESKADLEIPTAGHDSIILSIKDNNPKLYDLMNSYRIELKTAP